ncbi:deformed epidermal autoregulatory factor 1 homolog isoform X1 [Centruroides vittatus]|uniref:deformed epidermal autoregulatory factor 1 homolog isoform X1 n=1 Tax=Centruroides vittatus TaxID=120091 RepID=UPI003510939D
MESGGVPLVATPDLSEDMPNSDVTPFPPASESGVNGITNVVFATPQGILTPEQLHDAGIKTTHIVIHDQSTLDAVLKAQPSTPSPTPLGTNGDKKFKYNWDPSVHDSVLPVRCRNVSGELHKNRFGSGGRGRCIKVGENWYTPSEFEALCGRGNSKDWKRSIRYAGRTLQCLIEEGILQPHATSCTCTACCDDTTMVSGGTVSGPIRLFTPYKRRKREDGSVKRLLSQESVKSGGETPPANESMVVTLAPTLSASETIQVVTATVDGAAESVIVTPVSTPQTPRLASTQLDFSEQRQWWQLEEMVKNLVHQVQELQKQVEAVRSQGVAAREASLQQLRIQMEKEKAEAINNCRIEAQVNLSKAILEVKNEKDAALQQLLEHAKEEIKEKLEGVIMERSETVKKCANCNRESLFECTSCHQVTYCGTFCQQKDWPNHEKDCTKSKEESIGKS